jgi:large subunit ribosomal protein L15
MKIKKRKKYSRMHGHGMGTAGTGARKNKRKSGNKGGGGMSGSGKRADHKKTLVNKMYGHNYFGKQGITSRKTKRDVRQRINLKELIFNVTKFGKKTKDGWEISLPKYKILGTGEVKEKLIINCLEASASAIEKVEKAGGKIIVKQIKVMETPFVEHTKKKK